MHELFSPQLPQKVAVGSVFLQKTSSQNLNNRFKKLDFICIFRACSSLQSLATISQQLAFNILRNARKAPPTALQRVCSADGFLVNVNGPYLQCNVVALNNLGTEIHVSSTFKRA